jgi:hypothetical protein
MDPEGLGGTRGNVVHGGGPNQRWHGGRLVVLPGLGPIPDN